MDIKTQELIPEKFRFVSGSALKIIACITMLIDHVGLHLYRKSGVMLIKEGPFAISFYDFSQFVGRIAFPIYCFLLVEGFLHTRDRKKYGINLFLFALISEIPWNLEHGGTWTYPSQNVFFTLFLGYLGICAIAYFRDNVWKMLGSLLVLLVLSEVLKCDYGSSGYGFILCMYLLPTCKPVQAIVQSCFLQSRWRAGLAFIPILFYNGKRGFIKGWMKYLFYAFYPVHIYIIYLFKYHKI